MIKKRIAAVLAVTAMLVSAIPFSVSAHTNDNYFTVQVSSTTSVSIDSTAQKKDNTTSSYIVQHQLEANWMYYSPCRSCPRME